jgi:hypothetical protein
MTMMLRRRSRLPPTASCMCSLTITRLWRTVVPQGPSAAEDRFAGVADGCAEDATHIETSVTKAWYAASSREH